MRPPARSWLAALVLLAILAACAGGASVATAVPGNGVPAKAGPSADWSADMGRFAAEDAAEPPAPGAVVFTGSSSIRMWTHLQRDLAGIAVLNRGFGGAELRDLTHHADEIALRYRPARIVVYAGDNDLAAGRSPEGVAADFRTFVERLRRELPRAPITFIAIKPSPARVHLLPLQVQANALVRDLANTLPGVAYLDVATPMLDAGGRPRDALFLEDGLHLNAAGYALWRQVVARHLGVPPADADPPEGPPPG